VRQDAPDDLRGVIVDLAYECGMTPKPLRRLVSRVLRTPPNPNNWSEYPNIDEEVRENLRECPWYRVYDATEAIYALLRDRAVVMPGNRSEAAAEYFAEEINSFFRERGIGWQLLDGSIEVRGAETFEQAVHGGRDALEEVGKATAAKELHEALGDLSRRPEADITGAIQHAMAALECVARDAVGDQKATLGEILRRYPELFPPPLDQALHKIWGYASEAGRHLKEGKAPEFDEAELIVGACGTMCRYLARKISVASASVFNS